MIGSSAFMPHGMCYQWRPDMLFLHVVSDGIISLAYFAISCTILYFVRKRIDLQHKWVFLCFSVFIVACGFTHAMEIWTIWHPVYWLSGGIKAVTAVASAVTAILLIRYFPSALRLPTPSAMQSARLEVEREVRERKRADEQFRLAMEAAPTGMLLMNMGGSIVLVNAQIEKLFGYPRAELLGQPIEMLVPERLRVNIPEFRKRSFVAAEGPTGDLNDAHGHAVGDAVLRKIAERLRERARQEDTVCRNGGDEFLYLLMNPGGQENLERIAHSISSGVAQPVPVGEFEFAVKPSIGIAIYPSDGYSGKDLIAKADAAMYRAKRDPRGVVLYGQTAADVSNTA